MNDELFSAMTVFVHVAREGGFSAAARTLAVTPATVSRKVARLESRLGVRLFSRTTRRVALTEAGEAYFKRCAPLLDSMEEAGLAAAELSSAPRGLLRVHAPVSFARLHLAPRFQEFLARYPQVRLDVTLADRIADLIDERIDVAIRVGELRDSRLVARRLMTNRRMLCASPAYLENHGTPQTLEMLEDHECLCASYFAEGNRWRLEEPQGTRTVRVDGRMQSNNVELLLDAALAGHGIALLDTFAADKALAEGRLVNILPEWSSAASQIHIVYPSADHLPAKVRVFIDFLLEANGYRWNT